MAEKIKQLHNNGVGPGETAIIVQNDADTEVLVKEVWIVNTSGIVSKFNALVDGLPIYLQQEIDPGQTVKLDKENIWIPANSKFEITNDGKAWVNGEQLEVNSSIFYVTGNEYFPQSPTATAKFPSGKRILAFNDAGNNYPTVALFDKDGEYVTKTNLSSQTNKFHFYLMPVGDLIFVFYSDDSSGGYFAAFNDQLSLMVGQVTMGTSNTIGLAAFKNDSPKFIHTRVYSNGGEIVCHDGLSSIELWTYSLSSKADDWCDAASLSNGNVVVAWCYSNGDVHSSFAIFGPDSNVPVVNETQIIAGRANKIQTVGFDDGSFALFYSDATDGSKTKIEIRNNDGTVKVAPSTILDSSPNFGAFKIGSNKAVLIYGDGSGFICKIFNSNGEMVATSPLLLNGASQEGFTTDPDVGSLTATYYQNSKTYIHEIYPECVLNVKADGVEVIE